MANNKKYISLNRLSDFLDNLKNIFASLSHKHSVSDLTDYTVDTSLSSTSANPVQNKVLDAEFEAVSQAMGALEQAIDGKLNASDYVVDSELTSSSTNPVQNKAVNDGINLVYETMFSITDEKADIEHTHTKEEIGLENVDNTADAEKHVNYATTAGVANSIEWKNVSNKPFSTQINGTVVLSTVNVEESDDGNGIGRGSTGRFSQAVVTGEEYKVVFDGAEYYCVAYTDPIMNDYIVLGNFTVIEPITGATNHVDTGEPFLICYSIIYKYAGVYTATIDSHTVEITHIEGVVESIDESCIPDTIARVGDIPSIDGLATETFATEIASEKLTEAKSYADNAANTIKNDLLNGAGAAYDTLKELGDLIDDNTDAIDALEDIAAGKADKLHPHEISDVNGLQNALNNKADSSHGTHVSYSTITPVMDGTASVGTASTVARSDHKHPTDTSRASKTEFDTHVSDTTKHITSSERTNWETAYTHSQSAHAPSNAEKNQNAFSNVKVGSTTVAADAATDTLELVGSNVTITPDATNDKITFTVADGSTSAKGVVQLTNSTSSTSTTTAATPSSVKSAYDLANTANTNAATAQTRADSAYTLAESKVDSLSDLGITATATELNYMDGVTSNVQTQLDTKADAIHIHPYGVCSSSATYTTKTVTVNNFELVEGARIIVKFTNANSASSPKLNVNGTGAIPIMRYGTTAVGSNAATNGWEAGAVLAFTYDGTNWVRDYWYNTTYTNIELGQGFGYCYTSSSVADKEVTMSNYEAKTGGIVSVKFSYSVDAGEITMNINGKGAKTVNYMGSDMIDDVIKGGDIATFIYTGSTYHLISVDRWFEDIAELQANDSRVRQMPTTTNGNFRLLLTPSFQSEETTAYTYFNTNLYANPYSNKIYADISGTSTGVKGVTAGNFLVGNGSNKMTEKTPAEVLSMINGASVASMTTAEYNALENRNANTLYMLTDAEEETSTQVQIITWEDDD